jgi:hypothetical protein
MMEVRVIKGGPIERTGGFESQCKKREGDMPGVI